jgi:hypothetical protein
MTRFRLVVLGLLAGTLLVPAAAFAGADPSATPADGGAVQGQLSSNSGALPFTGMNLVYILAGGALLIATGLVLRRRASSDR